MKTICFSILAYFVSLLLLPSIGAFNQEIWVRTYTVPQWSVGEPIRFSKTVAGGFVVASTVYNASISNVVVTLLDSGGEVVWGKMLDIHPIFRDLVYHVYSFRDGYLSVAGLYGFYGHPFVIIMDPKGLPVRGESVSVSTRGKPVFVATEAQLVIIGGYEGINGYYVALFNRNAGFTKLYEITSMSEGVWFMEIHSASLSKNNVLYVAAIGGREGRRSMVIVSAINPNGTIIWCRAVDVGMGISALSMLSTDDGLVLLGGVSSNTTLWPGIVLIKFSFNGTLEVAKYIEFMDIMGLVSPVDLVYDADGKPVILGNIVTVTWKALFMLKMDHSLSPIGGALLNYTKSLVLSQTLVTGSGIDLLLVEKNGVNSSFILMRFSNIDQAVRTGLFVQTKLRFNASDRSLNIEDLALTMRESAFTRRTISLESIRSVYIESKLIYREEVTPRGKDALSDGSYGGPSFINLVDLVKIVAPVFIPFILTLALSTIVLRRVNRDLKEYQSSP